MLPGSRARIVRSGGRYDPQLVKRSSEWVSAYVIMEYYGITAILNELCIPDFDAVVLLLLVCEYMQMTSMWWISASDCMMRRFAADNPSTLSCIIRRAEPMAWKPRSALSEGFWLALWLGSIRIRSTSGIFGFPWLLYLPRYSRGELINCNNCTVCHVVKLVLCLKMYFICTLNTISLLICCRKNLTRKIVSEMTYKI